jgi:2-(1,2-epoxy-1,2-dihydrophenyl)acetyl-CoA isomerase
VYKEESSLSVETKSVLIHKEGRVAKIALNRPHVFNAIDGVLVQDLIDALKDANEDTEIGAIVLTGEGKAFCSGQDLHDQSALQKEGDEFALGKSVRERYNPLIQAFFEVEKPMIAAVNGTAAGAGCSLALACDFRFITPKTRFVEAFVRIGLVPDSGSSYFLPRLVGLGRALEIAMTGRDVKAEEAIQIGLATRLVEEESLIDEALLFGKELAQGPVKAISLTKKAIYNGMECTLEDALEFEAEAQDEAGKTADFLEGITAFSEKRKPIFKGV